MNKEIKMPGSFWAIGIVGLIWNLMGVGAFAAQAFITPEAINALPEAQKAIYESTPSWMNIVFGIATIGGLLGCIALLMKKAWAIPIFTISLIAILIQMCYSWFMTDAVSAYGTVQGIVMPALVIIIGIYLLYYSKSCRDRGLIS